jgi:uncharacterized protein
MKKQLLLLTLFIGSSLMYAAAAPMQEEQELIEAAMFGYVDEVKRLLQIHGINVNAIDAGGATALMNAIVNERQEIVRILLNDPNIDVNAIDCNGFTALMTAATHGNKKIVEMLLNAGADKTMENESGMTAEQIARGRGYTDLADYIRDYIPSGQLTKSAKKR